MVKEESKITEDILLAKLHEMIDKKFNRKDRSKLVNPYLLKAKMTLWSIIGEFLEEDTKFIAILLKILILRGSIVSNIDEEGVFPADAYFIPTNELMSEKEFDDYMRIKRKLTK